MTALTKQEVLELIPQQAPFRYVDEILELSDSGIVSTYTFKPDEFFYKGHFPGNPITPGVILLEALAQTGVVAYGIYLASQFMPKEEIMKTLTVFTEADVEFSGLVKPGQPLIIRAKKVFFRRMKLKTKAEIAHHDGQVVCSGTIAGMGVKSP